MDTIGHQRAGHRWSRLRFAVAGVVAVASVSVVFVAPAAAGSNDSNGDCAALLELSDNIPDTQGSSSIFGKQAGAVGEGFAETAQDIEDRKLRKAMRQIAAFYSDAADVDNTADAVRLYASNKGKKYAKAFGRWVKAFTTCVTSSITIPSITLPSNVTLPSNITLPSIPRPR